VPYEHIPALLAGSHIGLEVALPTPLNTLLWPRKVFEYMAAGLPVIRADYPAWADFAPVGCLTVNPEDEAAIAAALLRLASDAGLRERLGREGRGLVEGRYHWEPEGAKLVALYESLIGPPAPGN
jgi:glycosyltransferase involved in cell wall biosynthesis